MSRATTVAVQGFAMRVIREARGRTQADLAAALGVERSYVTKIETGAKTDVGAAFYARLLRELVIEDYRALLASPPSRMGVDTHTPAPAVQSPVPQAATGTVADPAAAAPVARTEGCTCGGGGLGWCAPILNATGPPCVACSALEPDAPCLAASFGGAS